MSSHSSKQIFQTSSAGRWQRFKWGSRFILFCIVFGIAVIVIAMVTEYTPQLPMEGVVKKAMQDRKSYIEKTMKLPKEYAGFQKFINTQWAKGKGCGQADTLRVTSLNTWQSSAGIRSAFYVAWDAQSYFSLKKSISKLNLVLPEWFFLDATGDTLRSDIDKRAFDLVKASGVKVIPMLTNNIKEKWRGDVVHRIITNPAKRERLINDLIKLLKQNNFDGINIDFEELVETRNEVLSGFQKELYQKLHANKLLVTQDVSPFNEDYDYKALSNNNDYLFLMAYDEHSADTKPGSVSSQKWMEAAVGQMAKVVPANKIILGMAGYGYDWAGIKDTAVTITYQEALSTARESDADVDFDNDTYNLHYSYYDDTDKLHEVYFTDAGTNFNTLRFATEYGLAGTALWRLGSEDSRLWDFYDKDMSKKALAGFDFKEFNKVESSNDVDYIGEGEILDVQSKPREGHITPEIDTADMLISEERYDTLPSMFVVKKLGKPKGKQMVLSFDDGPDPEYTREILDTLSKYHVPASFFDVGIQAEAYIPLVKREFTEGHEIGNHTFSHPNMAEISTKRALLEMDATRLLIECITGHTTIMFRAPFNADSEPEKMEEMIPVALSRTRNYLTVGESIDPEDWQPGITADSIFNRIVRYQDAGNIILLHDAGGDRSQTVKALPRIIQYFRNKGYTFTTVASLLGKTRDEVMPSVVTGTGYARVQLYLAILESAYYVGHILFSLFVLFLVLGVARLLFMASLALKQHSKDLRTKFNHSPNKPLVSIIVPAYNEEVNAISSLQNLLRCDYENFDIIFVDDGSKDNTFKNVDAALGNNNKIKIFTKPNGGKASALNFGIAQTNADYVVCIDADTKLRPNAVRLLMRHFLETEQGKKGEIGAVAGNVKIGNEVNVMTRWQSIEYITSQNFDRKAFAYINAITVVPGAIGAFKKEIIEEAGGFTTDTLAEDCDLTIRILKLGYLVQNENNAIAMTEAPETIKQFLKQRYRWCFGVMQTFWKHRDALFNSNYKSLGWVAMPNILLFQFIIPIFSPLADILMIIGLFTENAGKIGKYYLLFMIVDTAIALLAFTFEKERLGKLFWLIPQRLGYRWLMYIVLFRSFRRAIKGELQHWGVLKRTGNVKDVLTADLVERI